MITSILNLIRWKNLIIVILTQYLVRIFLIDSVEITVWNDIHFHFLVISTVFIAAGGYIINDIQDQETDRINKPEKLIINEEIRLKPAFILYFALNIISLTLASFISLKIFLAELIIVFLLFLYSKKLKSRPLAGNLTVALLTAAVLLIIGLHYESTNPWLYVYAFFAFSINLIREIIKDIEDMEGDLATGSRTLPILIGMGTTKTILKALIILFLIILSLFIHYNQEPFFLTFIGLLSILLIVLFIKITRARKKQDFTQLSQFCKIIIIFGLLSLILFRIPSFF